MVYLLITFTAITDLNNIPPICFDRIIFYKIRGVQRCGRGAISPTGFPITRSPFLKIEKNIPDLFSVDKEG